MAKKIAEELEVTPVAHPVAASAEKKSYDEWAALKWTDAHQLKHSLWQVAACKAAWQWPVGKLMTSAEFEASLEKMLNLKINPA